LKQVLVYSPIVSSVVDNDKLSSHYIVNFEVLCCSCSCGLDIAMDVFTHIFVFLFFKEIS